MDSMEVMKARAVESDEDDDRLLKMGQNGDFKLQGGPDEF